MSVDTLRETFHINRVTPDKIQDFLTAQTYRPEITKAKEDIKALPWVFLQQVCKRPIRQGKSPSYADDAGLLCIKPKNTNEMIVSLDELSYIQPASKDEVAGQRLQRGDIVITRSGSGTIGRASIFLSDEEVYTNDHLFIVRTHAADSHYTCAFLNTYWGHRLLEAGISGSTGQLNLSNEHIKGITLYTPAELAQKYIGDKVRQAERLRAWAARAQEEAVREMPANKPMISHYAKSSYRVSTDTLFSARLDSSFFHPDHRALDTKMKESGCQYFGKLASVVKPGWNKKSSDSFLYYEIGGLNVSTGKIGPVETLTSEAPSRATTAVKQGDVLVSTVRPNRKNVGLVIEDTQNIPMVATSGFSVLRFESLIDAAFYHAWLRTDDATSQLMRWNSGSAYPAIDEDVPLQIFVPEFDASLRARLGQILLDTHFALLHCAKLTNGAQLLIEALIEGQLTEAELIAAEQALQVGNDQLDRRILNRLKTDGIDGQGPALFSDLDELYRLLAQAEVD